MKSALTLFLALAFTALAALAAPEKPARTDRGTAAPPKATPIPQPPPVPAVPLTAAAAPAASTDIPGQMASDFFAALQRGQIDDAYATLTKGSKTIEKPEDLRILKQKTREAIEAFGAITGYELVDTTRIGVRLMRRTYLSLGDEFPLRWRFYFYEANNRWRLIDLRVDDRLAGMFDEPKEGEDKSEKP
jgi:hypothetical protein